MVFILAFFFCFLLFSLCLSFSEFGFDTRTLNWIYHRDFIGECLKSPPLQQRPYQISVEQKALWTFLFGTMLFTAIIGNSIVIWIVLGKRKREKLCSFIIYTLAIRNIYMFGRNHDSWNNNSVKFERLKR